MRSATISWSRSRGCRAPTIKPQDASLHRALALDLGLGDFDPLTRDLADDFKGPRPEILSEISAAVWRTSGDTVERIELLALRLVSGVLTLRGRVDAHQGGA